MDRRSLLSSVVMVATMAACHGQRSTVSVVEPVVVAPAVGELSPAATAAIAPRVARLQLVPDSIVLAPGDVYSYGDLQVVALDSAGTALGRLRVYDAGMEPGAAAMIGERRLQGVHPGTSELTVRFPRALWNGGGDPPPPVHLHVTVRLPTAG
ncbi:MAG: hypothetical protein HOQ11_02595 [Gemmatimonadaceae bacterium]|nr:hypothetical protein [Gemmatimonadaceae bacterium]NUS96277.1 hypothetical protein [Gemmatimonadaceae bacterium]